MGCLPHALRLEPSLVNQSGRPSARDDIHLRMQMVMRRFLRRPAASQDLVSAISSEQLWAA